MKSKASINTMNHYPLILIESGIIVAFYDAKDRYHLAISEFLNISAIATLDKDFDVD